MTQRPPLLQPPIYLAGAPPADAAPMIREACQKAAPIASLVGATALGVTAAYFAPKFFDWALAAWRGRDGGYYYDDQGGGGRVEIETDDDE